MDADNRQVKPAPGSDSKVGTGAGSSQPRPCTCGFCDGVEIEVERVNLHTGAVEGVESFEKMSRRKKCPNCGGMNLQYRRSYVAHAADVVERMAGSRNVYALHVTLDAEAVQRAGIDPEATYRVWTDGGPWSRARANLRSHDPDLAYFGSLSARPSDGVYHLHLVLVTRLSVPHVVERLHVSGLDSYVQTFDRSEDADSKAQFAAMWAAYAFDNAAHGPSARFTSSRGGGVGYDSAGARERRQQAVTGAQRPDAPARGPRRSEAVETANAPAAENAEPSESGAGDGSSAPMNGERAPPVVMGGGEYRDRAAYFRAVKRKLMGRVGTAVQVRGMGPGDLLRVAGDEEGLVCTVAPEVGTGATEVRWTEIHVRNAPTLRQARRPRDRSTGDAPPEGDEDRDGPDVVDAYTEAAYLSRVTTELDDGRRHVTELDHRTGEVREYIRAPRPR